MKQAVSEILLSQKKYSRSNFSIAKGFLAKNYSVKVLSKTPEQEYFLNRYDNLNIVQSVGDLSEDWLI